MITVNISGGLGNQMFQYAAGYALARRLQQDVLLLDDMARIYGEGTRCKLGEVFSLDEKLGRGSELIEFFGWRARPSMRRLMAKNIMRFFVPRGMVFEPHFHYWPSFKALTEVKYLHGYWQSPQYFEGYENDIRCSFQFKGGLTQADNEVFQMMRQGPSVAIHIRRGDYTNSKNSQIYVQLGREYYQAAIRLMREKISDPRFYVFSDDPGWVRENILDDDSMLLVDHNTGINSFNDMRLMSLADHNIIANSTFSWWGAWLNQNPNKIVVSPRNWFQSPKMNSSDVCPSDWVRI